MELYNFNTKYGLINWIKDDFIIAFHPTTDEKIKNIESILSKKEYDDLYRLANMIDRFGWSSVFHALGLEVVSNGSDL